MILRLVREDTRDEECENEMAETDALAERDEEGAPEAAERDGFTTPGGDVPDGAVSDTPQDGEEEKEAGQEQQVDLASMEALLFSTHHPLTAGRLAELLDLDSTRWIRKAIKA